MIERITLGGAVTTRALVWGSAQMVTLLSAAPPLLIIAGAAPPGAVPGVAAPTDPVGPHPQWGDPSRIVSIDPWGASVQSVFADYLAEGYDIRPTIAVTKARIHLPEVRQAIAFQRLAIDGRILLDDASANVTKIAIEPVWWLPGVAERFKEIGRAHV